jgi:hypothetical protein
VEADEVSARPGLDMLHLASARAGVGSLLAPDPDDKGVDAGFLFTEGNVVFLQRAPVGQNPGVALADRPSAATPQSSLEALGHVAITARSRRSHKRPEW